MGRFRSYCWESVELELRTGCQISLNLWKNNNCVIAVSTAAIVIYFLVFQVAQWRLQSFSTAMQNDGLSKFIFTCSNMYGFRLRSENRDSGSTALRSQSIPPCSMRRGGDQLFFQSLRLYQLLEFLLNHDTTYHCYCKRIRRSGVDCLTP